MKNAKKSMFITTILMVAVLIVAVSTATFAWYTASNQGSATTAVVTSASADAANIAVGWTNDAYTTSVAFNGSQTVSPMVPNAELDTADDIAAITFQSAVIDSNGLFGTPGTGTPWTVSNAQVGEDGDADYLAADSKSSFFVINHNVNAGATVTVKANISGDLADMLLIAVFVDGKLEGILSNMSAYRVGPVEANDNYNDLADSTNYLKAASTGFTFDLGAKGGADSNFAEITLAAWLDGESLVSSQAGKAASFDLSFTAAPKNA